MLAMSTPSSLLALLALASTAMAHMELVYPIPFDSKFDPEVTNPDYSMTSPLKTDGSDFPCKGYQSMFDSTSPKAELVAGSNFNFTLTGSARHSGGSCELSVSYDQAKTFAVIHRISGGCPLKDTYAFQVPQDLPGSDKAIFAWTWFNEVGNREMYMNCAAVSIQGSSTSYTAPEIFKANVFADGTCRTTEGNDVQFPPVGAVSTDYEGTNTASTPATVLDNCPVDQGQLVTVTSSGNSSPASGNGSASTGSGSTGSGNSGAASSAQAPSQATTQTGAAAGTTQQTVPATTPKTSVAATTKAATTKAATTKPATSSKPATTKAATTKAGTTKAATTKAATTKAATTKAATTSKATSAPKTTSKSTSVPKTTSAASSAGSCTDGEIICDTESTWSMCSNGKAIAMGSVAGGMACRNGAMVLASATSSSSCTSGSITCSSDGKSWSQCANGVLYNMGSVAAGTTCKNGTIVASSSREKRMVRHPRAMKSKKH